MKAFVCVVCAFVVTACDPVISEPVMDGGVKIPNPTTIVAGGSCPKSTGAGVSHGSNVTTNVTWLAVDNPHVIPSSIRVEAVLTLEPCVEVRLADGVTITVGNGSATGAKGSIVAHGTYDEATDVLKPVLFLPRDANKKWGNLFVQQTGSLDFQLVALSNGGKDTGTTHSTIEARGTQAKPTLPLLRMRGVVIVDSGGNGVVLNSYATFTEDSDTLIVQGAEKQPLVVQPPAVRTIPTGAYTGNGTDEILVLGVTRLDVDEAFHDRGVPYRLDSTFLMYDLGKTSLTLTVDPGVKVRVAKESSGGYGFILGNKASQAPVKLIANGTAAKPIVFTSAAATPKPGDWAGILMANAPATGNSVSFTTIEYAGGFTGTRGFDCGPLANNGGLLIIDWRPEDAFVTHSTFRETLGSGIVSGWTVLSGQTGPVLTADNTFSGLAPAPNQLGSCDVSEWRLSVAGMPCRTNVPTCVGK